MDAYFHYKTPMMKRVARRLEQLVISSFMIADQVKLGENMVENHHFWFQFNSEFQEIATNYLELSTEPLKGRVQCKEGCSNCCSHSPQSVEPFESLALYIHLRGREDFSSLIIKLFEREQSLNRIIDNSLVFTHEGNSNEEDFEDLWLHKYFELNIPCPFLKNNSCSVYEHRPQTCRLFMSISEPQYCLPDAVHSPENQSFLAYLPDEVEFQLEKLNSKFEHLNIPQGLFSAILWWNQFEGEFQKNSLDRE